MNLLQTSIIQFDVNSHTYQKISLEDFAIDTNENIIYWIHFNLAELDHLESLTKKLFLPENVLDLFAQEKIIPTLIENNDSLIIQTECLLTSDSTNSETEFGNLIFYLTPRFCLTAASTPLPALTEFDENYSKYVKYAETPCFILFLILDNAINDFSKFLYDFELTSDQIDLRIRDEQETIYSDVMAIKKQVMKLQHHIAAIRDILMRISGRKIPVISEACRSSLGNLLDHTKIIFNEAEAIRDNLRNTLDQIDNALMQKMNHTMRVLTAFASIFLPLTVIAGIYGMNFDWMPELHWKYGYFWALGLMVAFALGLVYFFKKKKWF